MKKLSSTLLALLLAFASLASASSADATTSDFQIGDFEYSIPTTWVSKSTYGEDVIQRWHYGKEEGSLDGGYVYFRLDPVKSTLAPAAPYVFLDSMYAEATKSSTNDKSSERVDVCGNPSLNGHYSQELSGEMRHISFTFILRDNVVLSVMMIHPDMLPDEQDEALAEIVSSIRVVGEVEEEDSPEGWRAYYQDAEYERFNSPASENGLDGTLIKVSGRLSEKVTKGGMTTWIIEQEDGKKWATALTKDHSGVKTGEPIICYGAYLGVSKVLNNIPIMMLLRYEAPVAIIEQDVELYLAYEGLTFDEIHESMKK